MNGKAYGDYGIYKTGVNPVHYITNKLYTGELNIEKLDSVQQIIYGTFWFNGVNDKGDTVKVTDGRFDMHYVK